jgi:hypothetical protein
MSVVGRSFDNLNLMISVVLTDIIAIRLVLLHCVFSGRLECISIMGVTAGPSASGSNLPRKTTYRSNQNYLQIQENMVLIQSSSVLRILISTRTR